MSKFKQVLASALVLFTSAAAWAKDNATSMPSEAVLSKSIETVEFKAKPLENALDELARKSGANIVVDWPSLREAKIAGDMPITLSLRDIRLSIALDAVLAQTSRSEARLGYEPRDGIVYISTESALARHTEVRVYGLAGLRCVEADATQRRELQQAIERIKKYYSVYPPPWHRPISRQAPSRLNRMPDDIVAGRQDSCDTRHIRELAAAIRSAIDPESWRSQGGRTGTINIVGDTLVIRQNLRNHEAIARLLNQLRSPIRNNAFRRE